MSASYPLVRNVKRLLDALRRVRADLPASGSSPSAASSFLISSCIVLFYLSTAAAQSPDALYADRAHLESARQAAAAWSTALANDPANFEAAWKLARADYWLGGHAPEAERRRFLEQGIDAGRTAVAIDGRSPRRALLAGRQHGCARGVVRNPRGTEIPQADQRSVRDGAAARSRLRAGVRGSRARPMVFQGAALVRRQPQAGRSSTCARRSSISPTVRLRISFSPNCWSDEGRKEEARAELQQVLDAPLDPEWTPEDQEFKAKARALIQRR